MNCDLHTHSICSDGSDTPSQIAEKAARLGLTAVALTDHNTTAGLSEFMLACEKQGIKGVPGVELSTEYKGTEFHILALFLKKEHYAVIEELVSSFQKLKRESNILIVERLRQDGYDVDYDEILRKKPDGRINRFHIADELMKKGYVKSVSEAMDTLLSPKNKYYTPPERLSSLDAIALIKKMGCVAVHAHPFFSADISLLEEFFPLAGEAGLDAIETEYTLYDEETTLLARKTADKYGFLHSGGSDYHGINKPETKLAEGKGNLSIPDEFYYNLLKRINN